VFVIGLVVAALIGLWELGRHYLITTRVDGPSQRARVETAQIANAISAFKAKMNVGHVPAGFRLKAAHDPADPEAVYLRQVFPQLDLADNGLPPGTDDRLDPNQALVFFLTGGRYTNYQGFSRDKQHPLRPPADAPGARVGPFLDVTADRLDAAGRYLDPWGTPYAYLAYDPASNDYPDRDCFGVRAYRVNGKAMNPKGFQIISAGPDRRFGPGGDWTPGEGPWAAGGPGADDLANFNLGPLGRRAD
jgi:hypothetical protein